MLEYSEKTTDLPQVTHTDYYIMWYHALFVLIYEQLYISTTLINTVEPVLQGHLWDKKKVAL